MARGTDNGGHRRRRIVDLLRTQSSADIADLARWLGVSENTVRRDLQELEEQNVVLRTHGKASLAPRLELRFRHQDRHRRAQEAKRGIARAAAALVQPDDAVFLDTGTTNLELARVLARRRHPVTIVTPSLPIGNDLWGEKHVRVLMLGGELSAESPHLTGLLCEHGLGILHVSRAFLGCDAVHPSRGFFTAEPQRIPVLSAVLRHTPWRCVLAEGRKIGLHATTRFACLEDVNLLITDTSVPPAALAALRGPIPEVRVVGSPRNGHTPEPEAACLDPAGAPA